MNMIIHEANGVQIGQRSQDGYINATAMTRAYFQRTGKRRDVNQWLKSKRTKESIKHLSSVTQICVTELYQVFQGGNDQKNQGTWIHPRLAVRFAVWLDDDFGYMVETWVMDWLTDGQKPIQPQPQIAEIEKAIAPISDISYAIEWLAELERQLILALAHCKATHGIVEQRLVDLSMNKIIDTIAHQQRNKLESALGQISALRSTILAVEEAVAIPQSFKTLVAEIEVLRLQKEKAEQQLALLKQNLAAKTPQHKVGTLRITELQNLSKQERVHRYLNYLETLPADSTDLNTANVTNKAIALRLGCDESTVRKAKKDRGIAPRKYQK